MPKHGKKYEEASKLIDKAAQYEVSEAIELVKIFLTTEFEGGRHERRVNKIPC